MSTTDRILKKALETVLELAEQGAADDSVDIERAEIDRQWDAIEEVRERCLNPLEEVPGTPPLSFQQVCYFLEKGQMMLGEDDEAPFKMVAEVNLFEGFPPPPPKDWTPSEESARVVQQYLDAVDHLPQVGFQGALDTSYRKDLTGRVEETTQLTAQKVDGRVTYQSTPNWEARHYLTDDTLE
jgi:hypothetical protein